ncbi:hypothetical protein PIB30_027070 [Stylosanthes scabra]|uniref:Uncharacterized protein n=1 Tax=Stylosanthes scabra TaxID=79078 RepID=A0ABU6TAT3_9FABA|nr:hypothetical protein [Stylosanthes scabra]
MEKKMKRRQDTIDSTQEHKKKRNKIKTLFNTLRESKKGASTNDGTVTGTSITAPTTLSFKKRAKGTTLSATSTKARSEATRHKQPNTQATGRKMTKSSPYRKPSEVHQNYSESN